MNHIFMLDLSDCRRYNSKYSEEVVYMAFTVIMNVLAFGIALSVLSGALTLLILLPQFIYQIPYNFWCGYVHANEKYPATKERGIFRNTINATKLYKHWIFHKELDF